MEINSNIIIVGDYNTPLTLKHRSSREKINKDSSVQSFSHVQLFATPWTAACQTLLSITNSRSLLKLISTESVMPSNHLILCYPLLLPSSIFPRIKVFSNESVLYIRRTKYWSFSFSISPSNEYSGLISFRIDWFYLFAAQGTLKSLHQCHSSKASIWCPQKHQFKWVSTNAKWHIRSNKLSWYL